MNKRIGLEKQKRDVVFLDVVQLPGLTVFCCCVSIIYEKKNKHNKKIKNQYFSLSLSLSLSLYIYIYIEKEKNMKMMIIIIIHFL